MIAINERIAELRLKKNLSQAELSAQLKLNKNAVARFESGRQTPNKEQQEALCNFFSVSLAYLRGETNDPTRQDSWMDMFYSVDEEQDSPSSSNKKDLSSKKSHKQALKEEKVALDDSAFVTALLKSKAAQDIIRQIVREELQKMNR